MAMLGCLIDWRYDMGLRDTKAIDGDLVVIGRVYEKFPEGDGTFVTRSGYLSLTQENNTLHSTETFKGKHVHVLIEYETDGVHHGSSVDLHPYNNSICLSSFLIGQDILTGYIDEEGHIVLSVPSGLTLTDIHAHYVIYDF